MGGNVGKQWINSKDTQVKENKGKQKDRQIADLSKHLS